MKNKMKIVLSTLLLSSVLSANDGWGESTYKKDDGYNQTENYSNWVDKNTVNRKYFGMGYDEGGLGVTFGVNTNFGIYDTDETNFYTTIDFTNYRLTFTEGYDILQNNGLRNFQIIPFVGFSVDTRSSELGTFGGVKARYNVTTDWAISASYKHYFDKPLEGSADDKDDVDYFGLYGEYNF